MTQESLEQLIWLGRVWTWFMYGSSAVLIILLIWMYRGLFPPKPKSIVPAEPSPTIAELLERSYFAATLSGHLRGVSELKAAPSTSILHSHWGRIAVEQHRWNNLIPIKRQVPPGLQYLNILYESSHPDRFISLGVVDDVDHYAVNLIANEWWIGNRWGDMELKHSLHHYHDFAEGVVNRSDNPTIFVTFDLLMEYILKQSKEAVTND